MTRNKGELLALVRKIIFRQMGVAIFLGILASIYARQIAWEWIIGLLAGMLDNILLLRAIVKGMEKDPKAAVGYMRKTMLLRIVSLASISIIISQLSYGYNVTKILLGAIVLYIGLIINFVHIFYTKK